MIKLNQSLLSFTFCSQTGDTSYHITIEDYPPSQDDEYFFVSCVLPFHTYMHSCIYCIAIMYTVDKNKEMCRSNCFLSLNLHSMSQHIA